MSEMRRGLVENKVEDIFTQKEAEKMSMTVTISAPLFV